MTSRADLEPADVVRGLFQCIEERRWDDAYRYMDPEGLERHYLQRAREAETTWGVPVDTPEDFLRNDPGMPEEVARSLAESSRRRRERLEHQRRLHGWPPTLAELEAMTPAQVLGLALKAADRHEHVGAGESPPEPDPFDDDEARPHHRRDVVGEVVRERRAWVVYLSYWLGPRLVSLRRSDTGWGVLPFGEVFGQSFSARPAVVGEGMHRVPLPVTQPPWSSRRFEQQLSVELFPAVLERFRGAPDRARLVIQETLPWLRTVRPDGQWSIQEHLGHLLDLEELGVRRLASYEEGADVLEAADKTNRRTHEADHNRSDPRELLARFRQVRMELVAALARLPRATLAHAALHPRLQRRMNVVEWVHFMCEHDDHHLARMREIAVELMARWRATRLSAGDRSNAGRESAPDIG